MRLWSIHPQYLDRQGLIACWREGLGAVKALEAWCRGKACGYQNHPQLLRFKEAVRPVELLVVYMQEIRLEGVARGYKLDEERLYLALGREETVTVADISPQIPVTAGQITYEAGYLLPTKMQQRKSGIEQQRYELLAEDFRKQKVKLSPVFSVIDGSVEDWEKLVAADWKPVF